MGPWFIHCQLYTNKLILAPRIQTLVIYYVIVGKNILEFIVVLEIDAALQLWKDYFKNLFRDLRAMLE